MKKLDRVLQALISLEQELQRSVTALEISQYLGIDRSNVSRDLKQLYEMGQVERHEGRPVRFSSCPQEKDFDAEETMTIDTLAREQPSLQVPVQQAKAAILYPPRGLHTLILGETGVGKTMFAELMHQFAIEAKIIGPKAPFISFNCADYADNPQLVMAQIFGVKKGAYTGAEQDRDGLLKKAHGGILFLDEVHRLSPQGQEMLFTYIDTGSFRPLGETEKSIQVSVQIIAATTENPEYYLLNTFTRRIPMMITLPSLREKSLTERYHLIEHFIKKESKRVNKSIYINRNALISLLLYDCPNNIGQLGSDIQLACAKAFVNYKSKGDAYILISQSDLPYHVKMGMMKINEAREAIDQLLKSKGEILRFHHQEEGGSPGLGGDQNNGDFYDIIEKKLEHLKESGIPEEEINQIINIDLESHFQKYLGKLKGKAAVHELSKILTPGVLEAVEEMLTLAQEKLKRTFDKRIYYGLALHVNGFLERIKKGAKIYHPRLNTIRVEYPEEFLVAMDVMKVLDRRFDIHTPLDEIGYLTLFLTASPLGEEGERVKRVGVVVIMHGRSTASSMVEVCNTLVGEAHAVALDMPLSMKPKEMYQRAKAEVMKANQGKGVLLLVDMGSLSNFGEMIYEETGIIVKTITSVSTPIALEACRKAVLGVDINQIYNQVYNHLLEGIPLERRMEEKAILPKEQVIVTACYTGEGAAEGLKKIIHGALGEEIQVLTLNIISRKGLLTSIHELKEKYTLLAIVSTVPIQVDGIPYVSAQELIAGEGLQVLQEIVQEEDKYQKIGRSLKNHLNHIPGEETIQRIRLALKDIQRALKITIKQDAVVGIVLHLCFLIDKLKGQGQETYFGNLEAFKDQFNREMLLIKNALSPLEKTYEITIGEHELAYICKMTLWNQVSQEEMEIS